MNNGKICVSICAETADEFARKIKRAEEVADVVELRFDCLVESELYLAFHLISKLKCKKTFLATFRPKNKDEEFIVGLILDKEYAKVKAKAFQKRISVWKDILSIEAIELVDFEDDLSMALMMSNLFDAYQLNKRQVIFSHHNFSGVPETLNETFIDLCSVEEFNFKSNVVKIAAQANEINDSISIWKLLEKAKSENKPIIPIAMGEAGKWTRILGLAHGAFMTYAALETGGETAPGQISAKDLIETYRVKELNNETEVYGIIGNPVSQSISPEMHNAAFKFHDLNAVYIPFEIKDLDSFLRRMVRKETREIDLNFKGFSVTIPHKQAIIEHLDFVDETARAIGAVNTVKIIEDKLYGYNTDAEGFIQPLKRVFGDLKNARIAVLGAGGAARAAIYALKKAGAEVTIFARNLEQAKHLADEFSAHFKQFPLADQQTAFSGFDVLVNTTPIGMKGKFENETPVAASQIKNLKLVYDLVYNPLETLFLREAVKANVPAVGGLEMLIAQAARQFEIWTEIDAPLEEMTARAHRKLNY